MDHWMPEDLYAEFVRHMPICTVDVMLFDRAATELLLFRRRNSPLKGEWFTLGGRLAKNETVRDCALRQADRETGLQLDPARLFFGSVFDEIYDHSRFGRSITYHCVNVCWGYVLQESPAIRLDEQHDTYAWKAVTDSSLHCLLRRKIDVLLPLATEIAPQLQ